MNGHPPSALPSTMEPADPQEAPADNETVSSITRRRIRRSMTSNQKALVGATIICLMVIAAVFAPLIAPYDPNNQDLSGALQPPLFAGGSVAHPLGTDGLGRDVLSRIIFGSRVSLLIGVVSVVVSGVLGIVVGAVAGYAGRIF